MATPQKIAVVGAGIVGVSTALWLKRDGHDVTLFDRISLLSKDGPLFLKWGYLPKLLPWLIPFLRGANESSVRRTATALADILGDSVDQHAAIARGTEAEKYITTGRYTFLYRDRAYFAKDALGFSIRAEHGFTWDELDRDALQQIDPHLGPDYSFGAAVHDHGWITNPGAYVAALFEAFRALGGEFKQSEVDDIQSTETATQVSANGETTVYDRLVLASGAWSRKLAERLQAAEPVHDRRREVCPDADGTRCPRGWAG